MRIQLLSTLGLVLSCAAIGVAGAQTPVHNSFGPGGTYSTTNGLFITNGQWIANPFFYTGPAGGSLYSVSIPILAPIDGGAGIAFDVSLLVGVGPSVATTLESWTGLTGTAGVLQLVSALTPGLTVASTYWILLSTSSPGSQSQAFRWAWQSDAGASGYLYTLNQGQTWFVTKDTGTPLAFAVDASTPSATVPEPATMARLATGLVSMAVVRRRRPQA